MRIDLRQARDRVTVIAPDGRLTVDTVSALRESVRELVEGGALHVIVDMSAVTFMDTVGLAGILGGMKSTREQGGDLRIAGANEMVREMLDMTALSRVILSYATVEDALRQL